MIPQVETYRQSAVREMERFLRLLALVPDDKLDWAPTPTAKSALQVGAHTAVTAGNFARFITERGIPQPEEVPEFLERTAAAERAVTTREEVESTYRANTAAIVTAMETVQESDLQIVLDSGNGWTMSFRFLLSLPGVHAINHIGQIDYLHTCWGDMEVHF